MESQQSSVLLSLILFQVLFPKQTTFPFLFLVFMVATSISPKQRFLNSLLWGFISHFLLWKLKNVHKSRGVQLPPRYPPQLQQSSSNDHSWQLGFDFPTLDIVCEFPSWKVRVYLIYTNPFQMFYSKLFLGLILPVSFAYLNLLFLFIILSIVQLIPSPGELGC